MPLLSQAASRVYARELQTIDQMAGSIFAKLQASAPGEAFRAAMAGGGGQKNPPAPARHKNEARPAYTIPGVPMPIQPAPEQPATRPKAPPSPSRPGLKDKAKTALHQKAGEMKYRVEKALHHKVSSVILGNKDKKK